MPAPPSWLPSYAQDEWWTTGPELHRLGLLTVLDLMPFAAYCQSYTMWRTASETLARMAEKDPATSGLLVKRADGNMGKTRCLASRAGPLTIWFRLPGISGCRRPRVPGSAPVSATSRRRAVASSTACLAEKAPAFRTGARVEASRVRERPPAYALGSILPREPAMPPIRLSDDELDAVFAAARPIDPDLRDPFLRAVAHALQRAAARSAPVAWPASAVSCSVSSSTRPISIAAMCPAGRVGGGTASAPAASGHRFTRLVAHARLTIAARSTRS